jgi:hypothetical protein
MFRVLYDKYGAQAVYETGLEVLGFPPTWAFPSLDQILLVQKELQKKFPKL